jgi:iron complex outermembrane receptor protein
MNLKPYLALVFLLNYCVIGWSQKSGIEGTVTNSATGEPLISASVIVGTTGTDTDFDGKFSLSLNPGTYMVEVRYVGYQTIDREVTVAQGQMLQLNFQLEENPTLLQTATVTSGKYSRALGEVTVSLEVIKPQLLENTNSVTLDLVLNKVPGVDVIDGQANIRGGSGFSYGAGSRVLLLQDDIPILAADSGSPSWADVPVEIIDQVEVVKGSASALFGSSALNGIINVRTAYALAAPETKISGYYTFFSDPSESAQRWYDKRPFEFGGSVSHRRKIGRLDFVTGAFYRYQDGYNRDTYTRYGRFNLCLRYRQLDKLAYGLNFNFNPGSNGDFFFWKGPDSLFIGSDNTLTTTEKLRFNLDPFVTYFDPVGNRHKLLGRYYYIDNNNNNNQSNTSQLWYSEYQFQRNWTGLDLVTTAGVVYTGNNITAPLYGDTVFTTTNLAAYVQLEKKFFDRLNTSIGFRFENNSVKTPEIICNELVPGLTVCDTIRGGKVTESKPVLRFGANYQVSEGTYLRASWGQGYRFPTIAESFIQTTFGGFPINPNPSLRSETGWSAELGVKQGYSFLGFEGFLDVAAYWSQYQNMMEFNQSDPPLFGFQSLNVGGTDIKGLEITIAGRGKFLGLPTNILMGYNYLDPRFLAFDTKPPEPFAIPTEGQRNAINSSSTDNILKYRFRHTAKADIETTFLQYSVGLSANYYSFMEAIDRIFESLIVPGLKQYRQENDSGTAVISARASVKVLKDAGKLSLIVNNLFNEMYSVRPGLMEAPRNYSVRVDWKF